MAKLIDYGLDSWDAKKHGIRDDEIENKFSTSIGQFSRVRVPTPATEIWHA